ncbi:LysE family translocator [Paracoccus sp. CPCC 101403]|uniref:LysE family translocator n=2 Tax=Paracoccus broussonetiae TaxID=3075834 RepID=A0ABU3EET8_9RHOB|nr:LysE family translocator [Paracoccus sp. CPCC 101403]MDT1062758.1 LysE family translocator [Paracoccus sp. CPCC 101403]
MIWDTIANFPAQQLIAFMAGALVLNFAPGQDVFFASACGIQNGPRAGALAGLGVGLGVTFHVVMATIGLGALVAAHPEALVAIKFAGAGYLLWLAWKSWNAGEIDPRARAASSTWNIIRRGALSNLLNPKPVLFLLAFLPQFTRPEFGPIWQQILGLGLMFMASGTLVTIGYGLVGGFAGAVIGKRLGIVNRIAAVMFAGLALRLVWK